MLKTLSILLCALVSLPIFSGEKVNNYPFYTGTVSEQVVQSIQSNNGDIIVVSDSLPLFYYQDIATGVCHDHVCKPAFIRIYWDASASFLGFNIPQNTPLTKTEHQEFTAYDYYLLYSILNNPYSILGKMKYEELTSNKSNTTNEIDGTTGATTIVDKNAVVAGAAFTCYTLWNIVNDTAIIKGIRQASKAKISAIASINSTFNAPLLHSGELALFMAEANSIHKLKKNKYQKAFTNEINNASPLSALIINNYLLRQVFIFPEIERRLSDCPNNEMSFNKMLNIKE